MSLHPAHCGWCGGARRPALLAMASGKGPTDAAREVGCTAAFARYSLHGALSRGCYEVRPVVAVPTPRELSRLGVEARRRNVALLADVRASTARCLALAAQVRALSDELRAALLN